MNGMKPARTNVASIIAAARRNLKKVISEPQETDNENESDEENSQSGESDSDSDSDDDQVDDFQKVTDMQGDMLKDRDRDIEKADQSVESDDETTSESEDEDVKKESAKAAKYFDTDDSPSTSSQLQLLVPI